MLGQYASSNILSPTLFHIIKDMLVMVVAFITTHNEVIALKNRVDYTYLSIIEKKMLLGLCSELLVPLLVVFWTST